MAAVVVELEEQFQEANLAQLILVVQVELDLALVKAVLLEEMVVVVLHYLHCLHQAVALEAQQEQVVHL
jgi:hypothetical protein